MFISSCDQKFTIDLLKNTGLADEENCYKVLHNLELLSRGLLTFDEVDHEFNEVYIFYKKSGQYLKTNLSSFVNTFKGLVVGAKNVTVDNLITYVSSSGGKRYSRAEFEEFKKTRREFNKEKF